VSSVDPSTSLLGIKVAFPFGFSPAAAHKVAHPDGEIATSMAAAENNIPMALSAYGTTPMEEVISVGNKNPYFMQLNLLKDKSITKSIATRAEGLLRSVSGHSDFLIYCFLSSVWISRYHPYS
jgi:(S)-2-hydroxy-acid oxidase